MAGWAEQLVECFTVEVEERLAPSLPQAEREKIVSTARQALIATMGALVPGKRAGAAVLPTDRLRAADVIGQALVPMSQATLYRAVEQGRFYTTTPRGKSIGRLFPAWQFVDPVPELIGSVLQRLSNLPSSQIHAFWITHADELHELCPAEVLAGKPFETNTALHASQQYLLDQSAPVRQQKVEQFAAQQSAGKAGIIR